MSGPYGKGPKGKWQEPWPGESQSGGGKQGHVGSATWRAQMKGLKDFFFPDIEMQTEPAVSQDWGHKIYGSVCHKDRLRFS